MSATSGEPASAVVPPDQESPTKVYKGGCHCGKFAFECRHRPLEDGVEVTSCNCSICAQRGYLLIYITDPGNNFKFLKGSHEELTRYTFNAGTIAHLFCPVCGCGIFGEGHGTVALNLRAVKDVDLDSLTLKKYDGRAL